MTTLTAKKKSDDKGEGKIRSVRIEPAENGGAVVTCDREAPARKKGASSMMDSWRPPKPAAFSDMESAIEYAAKELGCDIPRCPESADQETARHRQGSEVEDQEAPRARANRSREGSGAAHPADSWT